MRIRSLRRGYDFKITTNYEVYKTVDRNFQKMNQEQEDQTAFWGCGGIVLCLYLVYYLFRGIIWCVKALYRTIINNAPTVFHWAGEHYNVIILLVIFTVLVIGIVGFAKTFVTENEYTFATNKDLLVTDYVSPPIFVLPLLGGPSAGKTSFLMASISALRNVARERNCMLRFPRSVDVYYKNKMEFFLDGVLPEKTNKRTQDSFNIDLCSRESESDIVKRICLYDPAGELFTIDRNLLEKQTYWNNMSGLIFIVDPFALREVKEKYQRLKPIYPNNLRVCEENQEKCLNQLLVELEKKGIIHSTNQTANVVKDLKCAVVVTKADALNLNGYEEAVEQFAERNPYLKMEGSSLVCRDWLKRQGESNLVNTLEAEFSECRYFFVSSLGKRTSRTTGAFRPFGIEEPWRWLLKDMEDESDTGELSFFTIFMTVCLSLVLGGLIVWGIIALATSN